MIGRALAASALMAAFCFVSISAAEEALRTFRKIQLHDQF